LKLEFNLKKKELQRLHDVGQAELSGQPFELEAQGL